MKDLDSYDFFQRLKELAYIESIYLYGSRARGDNSERSDIDLAILCPKATDRDWSKIMEIINSADTLLKIDCVRLDQISEENKLKKNIISNGKIIYTKNR